MQMFVPNTGQVAIPDSLVQEMGIHAGDLVQVERVGSTLVLRMQPTRRFKAEIVVDAVTGFPALTLGPDAPVFTSEQVKELLVDFP